MKNRKAKSKELIHVEHAERMLEYIAYGSLAFDFGIAAITLLSANFHTSSLAGLQLLLNYGITAILVVSIVLFLTIRFMIHYERILDGLARLGLRTSRRQTRIVRFTNRRH